MKEQLPSRSRMLRRVTPALVAGAVALLSSAELASAQAVAEPAPRLSISAGLGAAVGLHHLDSTQLALRQGLGYRLGAERGGLVLGVGLGESFGDSFVVLEGGATLAFGVVVDVGSLDLEVVPGAQLGVAWLTSDAGAAGNASELALDLQATLDIRLHLSPSWFVFVRPLGIDVMLFEGTPVRWDLVLGGGLSV